MSVSAIPGGDLNLMRTATLVGESTFWTVSVVHPGIPKTDFPVGEFCLVRLQVQHVELLDRKMVYRSREFPKGAKIKQMWGEGRVTRRTLRGINEPSATL
jgi:hypothetical protein